MDLSKGYLRSFLEKRGCTTNLINSFESNSLKNVISMFTFAKATESNLKFAQKADEDIPLILNSLNYPVPIPKDAFFPFFEKVCLLPKRF